MRFKSGRYTGVVNWLKSDRNFGAMSSAELLRACADEGAPVRPGAPIPPDLEWLGMVRGVLIHIRPKTRRGMEKRVYARCPDCINRYARLVWVEAGHLHQHTEARHT